VRVLFYVAGTADLGHQFQLCGNSNQLAHGSAGSALQQPVTQAGEAEVQAGGKGTPQESHCSHQWPGKTKCSVQMVSYIVSKMLRKQHMPNLMWSVFVVVGGCGLVREFQPVLLEPSLCRGLYLEQTDKSTPLLLTFVEQYTDTFYCACSMHRVMTMSR